MPRHLWSGSDPAPLRMYQITPFLHVEGCRVRGIGPVAIPALLQGSYETLCAHLEIHLARLHERWRQREAKSWALRPYPSAPLLSPRSREAEGHQDDGSKALNLRKYYLEVHF